MNQTKSTSKKLLALLLALIMTVSLLPMSVFAAELATDEPAQEAEEAIDVPADGENAEDVEPADGEEDGVAVYAAADEIAVQAATEIKYVTKTGEGKSLKGDTNFYRIFLLDCGRKYFSVSEIEGIIDQLAANHYTHIELAFGNEGLRFLLDDMKLTVDGKTYGSEEVKSAIQTGNNSVYEDPNGNALSQTEMDTIIEYANDRGIGVIPLFNAPGHMHAVVKAMETLEMGLASDTDYKVVEDAGGGKTANYAVVPTSAAAVNFVQALIQKYVDYFAGKRCTMFNIGADESGITSATYPAYAKLVNSMAAMVQNANMVAMAFNDGIDRTDMQSVTYDSFDNNIVICYWTAGTGIATSATLAETFKINSTHNGWYYVLGNNNSSWAGYDTALKNVKGGIKCTTVDGGITTKNGCTLAVWCDYPSKSYTTNKNNVSDLISTFAANNPDYFKAETPKEPELVVETPAADSGVRFTAQNSETHNYTVMVKPETENAKVQLSVDNAEGKTLTWTSYEPKIATVDQNGAVTFTGETGTVTITAKVKQAATQALRAATDEETVLTATFEVVAYSEVTVTKEKTITVTVGGTAKDVIEGVGLAEDRSSLAESIATVGTEETNAETANYNASATAKKDPYQSSDKLIDGNTATKYWSGSGQTVGDYVQVNIGAAIPFDAVRLTSSGNSGDICENADVMVSEDGKTWTKIGTYTGSTTPQVFTNTLSKVRYIKVVITEKKTNWWQLAEIEWGNNTNGTFTRMPTSGTVAVPASTNVTFTGVAEGTTYVTIGNVKYTINVVPKELANVEKLPIQLWITNNAIKSDQAKPSTGTWHNHSNPSTRYAYYVSIAAEQAYGVNGVLLSELVPAQFKGYENDGYYQKEAATGKKEQTLVFWSGRFHTSDESNLQSTWGTDQSNAGATINYVRYWKVGGEYQWQISADRKEWTTVTGEGSTGRYTTCTEQLVAYYMIRTEITNAVTTDVADWGSQKGSEEYTNQLKDNFVLLDFAVKYTDDTRVPNKFPVENKTLAYHCVSNDAAVGTDSNNNKYRRLNNFRGVETNNYEVIMITVTMTDDDPDKDLTSATAVSDYTYDGQEMIVWAIDESTRDKYIAEGLSDKYTSISGANSVYSGCTIGGDAYVRGVEVYDKHGALITYYVREKATAEDLLTVEYYVQGEDTPFYSYNIAVKSGTTFDKDFKRVTDPALGLENNTVKNVVDDLQTVKWDLREMAGVPAEYRYVKYDFVDAERVEDGKTVKLYYTFTADKTFVVDFGLPLTIKPADVHPDLGSESVTINEVVVTKDPVYASLTKDTSTKYITYKLNQLLKDKDTFKLRYEGTLMVEGQSEPQAGKTAEYTITIIPASNVYYEDSFVTFSKEGEAENIVGWTRVADAGKNPDNVIAAEKNTTQALEELGGDATGKNVYGYDPAYDSCTTFSMGSAMMTTVSGEKYATATFTFKGTGFDVISLTDNTSGAIRVDVYHKGAEFVADNRVRSYFVNNYYGYTYDNGSWEVKTDTEGSNALYQIPVMKVTGLDYNEYTVVITAAYNTLFDTAKADKYSFWLDAIRVYNPMGEDYTDYTKDGEGYPQYIKLRNELAKENDTTVKPNEKLLFIDGKENADVSLYKNYGPNNEVYLASGQAITFKVPVNDSIDTVQIGAKMPAGTGCKMSVNGTEVSMADSATEMYYALSVTPGNNVTIANTGSDILSLTNLKLTFTKKQDTVTLAALSAEDTSNAVAAVRALFAAPVEPDPEPVTFTPERFEVSWNRSTVKVGQKATLTVKTSEDVEAITVDGVTIDTYRTRTQRTGWGWNAKKVTYREFTYTITAKEAGTLDCSVAALNAENTASEAITAALTVQAAAQRPGFGGWLDKIFSRWF